MLNYQRVRWFQYETLAAIFITKQVHYCTALLVCEAATDSTCRAPRFACAFGATCPGNWISGQEKEWLLVKSQDLLIALGVRWHGNIFFLPHMLSRWHERGFDPTHVQAHDLRVASVYVMTYLWISRERKMSYVIWQTHVSCPVLFFLFRWAGDRMSWAHIFRRAGVTQTYRKKSRLCTFWFLKQMACSLFFCVKKVHLAHDMRIAFFFLNKNVSKTFHYIHVMSAQYIYIWLHLISFDIIWSVIWSIIYQSFFLYNLWSNHACRGARSQCTGGSFGGPGWSFD